MNKSEFSDVQQVQGAGLTNYKTDATKSHHAKFTLMLSGMGSVPHAKVNTKRILN
jgi:hypothetical protein